MQHTTQTTTYIGLGSNMQNPLKQLNLAVAALNEIPDTEVLAVSDFYWNKAQGPVPQDDFLNGVACLTTKLSPALLHQHLILIENKHGRKRDVRYGPRILDLDLLLYDDLQINTATLTIPHPEIRNRNFVLFPLKQIAPQLTLPTGEKIADLLKKVPSILCHQ